MLSHVKCEIANIQWFFLLTEMESNTNVGMEGNIKKIQSQIFTPMFKQHYSQ